MDTIIALITLFVIFVLTRPITTILHELGHAIPTLFLTKKKVTIYIGSMGDPNDSLKLNIGRLEIFFRYDPYLWGGGLCIPHCKEISINKYLIIILSGPLFSLIIGSLFFYIAFIADLHGRIKLISVVFLASSIFDFFHNILPNKEPIQLYDGSISYNDGQILVNLLKFKAISPKYSKGVDLFNNQEYLKASKVFQNIIDNGYKNEDAYRGAITSYVQIKDYESAFEINKLLGKICIRTSNDFAASGLINSQLGNTNASFEDYQKSLELNPKNIYSLNNRGFAYNLIEKYELAIVDFDKAIENENDFAYAYCNRGLAKIKLGQEDEGLSDIKISMKLDDKNSYVYRNLGIYYFDKTDYVRALEYFNKANELDRETHSIKEYINKTKEKMNLK